MLSPGSKMALKYFSLVALLLQNSVQFLVMRYIRTRGGDMFLASTAVIMSELIKFVTCLLIILVEQQTVRRWAHHLYTTILLDPMDCVKVAVPSLIYVLQNNLQYLAISNLDATTFQVFILYSTGAPLLLHPIYNFWYLTISISNLDVTTFH
jgi:UDP-sugar transporter A1/2/3